MIAKKAADLGIVEIEAVLAIGLRKDNDRASLNTIDVFQWNHVRARCHSGAGNRHLLKRGKVGAKIISEMLVDQDAIWRVREYWWNDQQKLAIGDAWSAKFVTILIQVLSTPVPL